MADPYPIEATVVWAWDTGILDVPLVLTAFETSTRYPWAGDLTNTTANEITYTLKNTALGIVAMAVVPPMDTIPLPVSPLRPCAGLKHLATASGLTVQIWGQ